MGPCKRIIRTTAALALIAGIAGGLALAAPSPAKAEEIDIAIISFPPYPVANDAA